MAIEIALHDFRGHRRGALVSVFSSAIVNFRRCRWVNVSFFSYSKYYAVFSFRVFFCARGGTSVGRVVLDWDKVVVVSARSFVVIIKEMQKICLFFISQTPPFLFFCE